MSNKSETNFDELTRENEEDFKNKFASMVGHTTECIEDTVNSMSASLHIECLANDTNVTDALNNLSIEDFDNDLRDLLFKKNCSCGRTKHLN